MPAYDISLLRKHKAIARQDYEKEMRAHGDSGGSYDGAGPPNWNRSAWDAFKASYGFYPFGMQNGTMVYPVTFLGAPDWVFEYMNMRRPPVGT
jgi:hypothetical protein